MLEAADADEATAILQKQEIQVDVVLTDIEMPGAMNGFAFAKWARSVRPELHIVLAGTPERAAHAAGELCEQGGTPRCCRFWWSLMPWASTSHHLGTPQASLRWLRCPSAGDTRPCVSRRTKGHDGDFECPSNAMRQQAQHLYGFMANPAWLRHARS